MVREDGSPKSLRPGSLAKETGVSPDTIRHYERIGVLPKAARTRAGYRIYPESAVERVRVVQRALRVGFTLAELAEVLKVRERWRSTLSPRVSNGAGEAPSNRRGHQIAEAY